MHTLRRTLQQGWQLKQGAHLHSRASCRWSLAEGPGPQTQTASWARMPRWQTGTAAVGPKCSCQYTRQSILESPSIRVCKQKCTRTSKSSEMLQLKRSMGFPGFRPTLNVFSMGLSAQGCQARALVIAQVLRHLSSKERTCDSGAMLATAFITRLLHAACPQEPTGSDGCGQDGAHLAICSYWCTGACTPAPTQPHQLAVLLSLRCS